MSVLVIDDVRQFKFECVYARTSESGYALILSEDHWDEIWFDHDLGGTDTTRSILLALRQDQYDGKPIPSVNRIVIHTSNPPGRDWLIDECISIWGNIVKVVDASWYCDDLLPEPPNAQDYLIESDTE